MFVGVCRCVCACVWGSGGNRLSRETQKTIHHMSAKKPKATTILLFENYGKIGIIKGGGAGERGGQAEVIENPLKMNSNIKHRIAVLNKEHAGYILLFHTFYNKICWFHIMYIFAVF